MKGSYFCFSLHQLTRFPTTHRENLDKSRVLSTALSAFLTRLQATPRDWSYFTPELISWIQFPQIYGITWPPAVSVSEFDSNFAPVAPSGPAQEEHIGSSTQAPVTKPSSSLEIISVTPGIPKSTVQDLPFAA